MSGGIIDSSKEDSEEMIPGYYSLTAITVIARSSCQFGQVSAPLRAAAVSFLSSDLQTPTFAFPIGIYSSNAISEPFEPEPTAVSPLYPLSSGTSSSTSTQ